MLKYSAYHNGRINSGALFGMSCVLAPPDTDRVTNENEAGRLWNAIGLAPRDTDRVANENKAMPCYGVCLQ